MITVSIVSHLNADKLDGLIYALLQCDQVSAIVVTINVPESFDPPEDRRITVIRNDAAKGFGENHNYAFQYCVTPYFCVLNPDVSLGANPFPALIAALELSGGGVAGPVIKNLSGEIENNARHFPNLYRLIRNLVNTKPAYSEAPIGDSILTVDWIAGMFMLFNSKSFGQVKGFDENFFLYYEDVDICRRLSGLGYVVTYCGSSEAMHDAQRTSRRNPRYFAWHVSSMLRYLLKNYDV